MTHDITLLRYINAVETGDLDTLSEIWQLAQDDMALTHELLELSAEIGGIPMYLNGLVRPVSRPQRTTTHRSVYRRVALFMVAITGMLALLALFSHRDSPIVTAPIGGATPTAIPPESLLPISVDNVDQLTQIAQYGEGNVTGVKWTPDGEHIIAYGSPGYWLYDVNDLDAEPQFVDLGMTLTDVAFTEDGETLVFSWESNIYLANLMTGEITYTLETDFERGVDLITGGGLIIYHGWDYERLYAWDIEQRRERFVFGSGITGSIVTMDFEESTNVIGLLSTTVNEEGLDLILIDAMTGEQFGRDRELPGGYFPHAHVILEKDRIFVSTDGEWFKWDAELENRRLNPGTKQSLDYDGTWLGIVDLVALHDDAGLLMYRETLNQPLYLYRDERLLPVDYEPTESWFLYEDVQLHPQRNEILFFKRESFEIIDAISGKVIDSFLVKNWQSTLSHVAYDQGRLIAHNPFAVKVWYDSKVYTTPEEITFVTNVLPGKDVIYLDGLVEQSTPGIIAWDYLNGTYEELFSVRSGVTNWAITHDRDNIYYAAVSSFLHRYDLLETRNTTLDKPPDAGPNVPPSNFVISPDDKFIALSHEKNVYVYDLVNGEFLEPLTGNSTRVSNLFFSPDGSQLYSLNESGNWIVWDTTSWSEILYREDRLDIGRTVMSPDGTIIAGSYVDEVVILDARTFEEIHRFKPHLSNIYSLAFSDDGKRIVTGSSDGTVRVWGVPKQ
ncbi:MAG: hypothetical protein L0154_15145 [Chloroflexi bacterium]|nr:hypothetical protein [Chloroflexota bacterium]